MKKDLALNNEDLRALNTKKLVNSVENIGEYFKELKHMNRINFLIGLGTSLGLLIMLGSIFIVSMSFGNGFMDNFIAKDQMIQRYNCSYYNESVIFRNVDLTNKFKAFYNESFCYYYSVDK